MKIAQIHNYYIHRGGEDVVLDLEYELLRSNGVDVIRFTAKNKKIEKNLLRTAFSTIWSFSAYRCIYRFLINNKPDILHVHNTFPQLSPSIYWAASALKIPIVQTIHNYRFVCANALLLRKGAPCELCVDKRVRIYSIFYSCYRRSFFATVPIFWMQFIHYLLGTYQHKVDAYIVMTNFLKKIMIRGGLPKSKLYVKPHFVFKKTQKSCRRFFQIIFIGRIASEKGVELLLKAWISLKQSKYKLVIVGDGPQKIELQNYYGFKKNIKWLGWQSHKDILEYLSHSRYLVLTSLWYETFGMNIIEAFSSSTPVIAPAFGGFPELIVDGVNGFLYKPLNVYSLTETLSKLDGINDSKWNFMSEHARKSYEKYYTPERNFKLMMSIYRNVLDGK